MANSKKVVRLSGQRKKKIAKKILKLVRIPVVIIAVVFALILSANLLGNVAMSNVTDGIREIKYLFVKGEGYPYTLDEFGLHEVVGIAGKPMIVTDDSTQILTSSAAKSFSMQLNSSDSKVAVKNGRALIYSTTSSTVTLQSRTEKLGTIEEEGTIITAALAKNGAVATAHTDDDHQSIVKVYNNHFDYIFGWECSQERISSMALSKNGKHIIIAAVGAENAEIYTRLILFNVNSQETVADLKYKGTLFLKTVYTDSGKIIAVGDNKTILLDKDGVTADELVYAEDSIVSVCSDSAGNTVICYEEFGGSEVSMVRYSKKGKKTFEITVDSELDCVANYGSKTAVAHGNEITVYNSEGEIAESITAEHPVTDLFWCNGTLYRIEGNRICTE